MNTYPTPEEMDAEGYTGHQKVMRAVALDGGYGWCREHRCAPADCHRCGAGETR